MSKKNKTPWDKDKKFSHSLLLWATAISMTVYIVWRLFFTIPTQYGLITFILGLLLVLAEMLAALESLIEYRQINKNVSPELPVIPESWYPDVDVLIATHNEPTELLYKTVNGCTFLKYPDKSKIHIYLCDDGNRPEMAQLANDLGVGYCPLAENNEAKAGNLNNALRQTKSPLVATFDSDMIPRSDFLLKTVPYFFLPRLKKDDQGNWVEMTEDDPQYNPKYRVGFIQTPQSFYNPDLFQFNLYAEERIPNEQDYFFQEVNVGRNVDNAVIYAGSNTLLSRQALEDVNYIGTTSITEDFLTGLRIQKNKYTTYATMKPLAHGLAPDTIKSLLGQRERWGRGCIQSLRQEHIVLSPKMKFWQKVSYFATLLYWWTYARRAIFILAPIVAVLFNMYIVQADLWQILLFWLPSYLLHNRTLRVLSGDIRNQHWSNVGDTILFPYMVGPIIMETLGIKKHKFVVTQKEKHKNKDEKLRRVPVKFAFPHIILLVMSALALVILIARSITTRSLYSPIILYWVSINLKNLVFAVFFMYGRENHRMADRFFINIPVAAEFSDYTYEGLTADVSETGLAILLEKPIYFPADEIVKLTVETEDYIAHLSGRISNVSQAGEKWRYSFQVEPNDENEKRQYLQIVFDRDHTLPKRLDKSTGIIDDFNLNLAARSKKTSASKRKLPRIVLDLPFSIGQNKEGRLLDFNYAYASLRGIPSLSDGEILFLDYGGGACLILKPAEKTAGGENAALYHVLNQQDFVEGQSYDAILERWLSLQQMENKATAMGWAMVATQETAILDS